MNTSGSIHGFLGLRFLMDRNATCRLLLICMGIGSNNHGCYYS